MLPQGISMACFSVEKSKASRQGDRVYKTHSDFHSLKIVKGGTFSQNQHY
jgi:hypothetical protein